MASTKKQRVSAKEAKSSGYMGDDEKSERKAGVARAQEQDLSRSKASLLHKAPASTSATTTAKAAPSAGPSGTPVCTEHNKPILGLERKTQHFVCDDCVAMTPHSNIANLGEVMAEDVSATQNLATEERALQVQNIFTAEAHLLHLVREVNMQRMARELQISAALEKIRHATENLASHLRIEAVTAAKQEMERLNRIVAQLRGIRTRCSQSFKCAGIDILPPSTELAFNGACRNACAGLSGGQFYPNIETKAQPPTPHDAGALHNACSSIAWFDNVMREQGQSLVADSLQAATPTLYAAAMPLDAVFLNCVSALLRPPAAERPAQQEPHRRPKTLETYWTMPGVRKAQDAEMWKRVEEAESAERLVSAEEVEAADEDDDTGSVTSESSAASQHVQIGPHAFIAEEVPGINVVECHCVPIQRHYDPTTGALSDPNEVMIAKEEQVIRSSNMALTNLGRGTYDPDINNSKHLVRALPKGQHGQITALAVSNDGMWCAAGTMGGHLQVWETRSRKACLMENFAFNGQISHLVWHPHQPVLMCLSTSATTAFAHHRAEADIENAKSREDYLTLWCSLKGRAANKRAQWVMTEKMQYKRSSCNRILSFAWHPDGKSFAVGTSMGVHLYPYDMSADLTHYSAIGASTMKILEHCNVCSMSYSPDGRFLTSASCNGTLVYVWDLVGNCIFAKLESPTPRARAQDNQPLCVLWSPDGLRLAVSGSPSWFTVWRVRDWACEWSMDGDAEQSTDEICRLHWHPSGLALLVTAARPFWFEVETGVKRPSSRGYVNARFSPDGALMYKAGTMVNENAIRVCPVLPYGAAEKGAGTAGTSTSTSTSSSSQESQGSEMMTASNRH